MTSVSLHRGPSFRVIWREQFRAVYLALHVEMIVFLGLLALGALSFVADTCTSQPFSYQPLSRVWFVLIGAALPFGVWRSEGRTSRQYQWAMPVRRGSHTMIKVLAGWALLLIGVAAYMAFSTGVVQLLAWLRHVSVDVVPMMSDRWVQRFFVVSISYFLMSILVVGIKHARWIAVTLALIGFGVLLCVAMQVYTNESKWGLVSVLSSILWGKYGLTTALFGNVASEMFAFALRMSPDHLDQFKSTPVPVFHPNSTVTLWAEVLWSAIGLVGLAAVSYVRLAMPVWYRRKRETGRE